MWWTAMLAMFRNTSGATAIEYALIAALVSVAFIIALLSTGSSIDGLFVHVADVLNGVVEQISGS